MLISFIVMNSFAYADEFWNTEGHVSGNCVYLSSERLEYSADGRSVRAYISVTKEVENYDRERYEVTYHTDWVNYDEEYEYGTHLRTGTRNADYNRTTFGLELYKSNYKIPKTPSSITIPTTINGGDQITVSWSASTYAREYVLERRVDGGAYSKIYEGNLTNFDDVITKGWSTVNYRVKGIHGPLSSGYRTGTQRTIINNTDPNIVITLPGENSYFDKIKS